MDAFVLEVVSSAGTRKGGKTFWSEHAATLEAKRLVRTGKAIGVRILKADVSDTPCADVTKEEVAVA
ncbi:MAG: hypothetical protein O3B86_10325 [Planctomycetota bacterium]|nr:hypothetical protein [Planctomycetota bacterium]